MKFFDNIRVRRPRLNKFDLSHQNLGSCNIGELIPIFVKEVIPGDKFRTQSQVFLRFLALLAPVMAYIDVTVHYFFVPNRLIWDGFEDFITGGRDGLANIVAPKFRVTDIAADSYLETGSLADYLGFPVIKVAETVNAAYNSANFEYSVLPMRAYQLIYDQYYRDQNLEASILGANFKANGRVAAGADLTSILTLRHRAFAKDYLTSCLPWLQRGSAVSVPITSNVTYRKPSQVRKASDDTLVVDSTLTTVGGDLRTAVGVTPSYMDNIASISSSSLTINALRASVRLQEWLEANARGGARYIEQIAMHFGVISSDARLQRAQYLGGGKQPVVISENLQTAPAAGGSTPLATMSGHGISVGSTNTFSKFFEEHGIVMGLMSVLVKRTYMNTMDRMFTRLINTDYYFPEFAHLGEQAVLNQEVYASWNNAGAAAAMLNVFGYNGRYSEYKYGMNHISGQLRESLNYWHFGTEYGNTVNLAVPFIDGYNVPYTPFAVQTDTHHLIYQVYNRVDALRPMPYFSTPSL